MGVKGRSGKVKEKYLAYWEQVFENCDPIGNLTKLANSNYTEFIKLGLSAMPREAKIDVTVSRYESWSDDDLINFLESGAYPDEQARGVEFIGLPPVEVKRCPSPVYDPAKKIEYYHPSTKVRRAKPKPVMASDKEEDLEELVEELRGGRWVVPDDE